MSFILSLDEQPNIKTAMYMAGWSDFTHLNSARKHSRYLFPRIVVIKSILVKVHLELEQKPKMFSISILLSASNDNDKEFYCHCDNDKQD